jgi:hypothetical protein
VIEGATIGRFYPGQDKVYRFHTEPTHILMKVETHNHPTAIAPFPGAATGSGGEIRDEGAVGQGSKPKAGLCGFTVSNLNIPGFEQPWEKDHGRPGRIVSPAADHAGRPHRRGGLQQRIRPAQPDRLFPDLRNGDAGRPGARLPQAHHAGGRRRQHPGTPHLQEELPFPAPC